LSEADAAPVPPPSPAAEDLALLLLSGGTTGVPKLVPRTHDDWACSGRAMAEAIPFGAGTVTMVGLPIAHNWTMTHGMLAAFIAGGTLVLAPGLDPESAFPLVEAERVTDVGLVPSMAALWVEEAEWTGHDLSSLRRVAVGGAKLGEEARSEEHTSELQSRENLVCRLLLEKKKQRNNKNTEETIFHLVYGKDLPKFRSVKLTRVRFVEGLDVDALLAGPTGEVCHTVVTYER